VRTTTREYPVKKGREITGEFLLEKAKAVTGNGESKDGHVTCTIPGLKVIDLYFNGKNLEVVTETDHTHSDPLETVRIFNKLIEETTGFSSKERKKKISKN
jgi:hypothetical protein